MDREPGLRDGRSLLINDAAAALGVSRRTVYYLIQKGQLETVRTMCGSQRVLMSSIDRLLGEGRRFEGHAARDRPGASTGRQRP